MNHRWAFPAASAYNRLIPKTQLYSRAGLGRGVKQLIVHEVDQILWAYILAPRSLNLPAHPEVSEVQVIRIQQRGPELSEAVLSAMDKAMPSPILFWLVHEKRTRYAGAYKRPSAADAQRWVIGDYHWSKWLEEDSPVEPLPIALDMRGLYHGLLGSLLPWAATDSLEQRLARAGELHRLQREAQSIESQVKKEKQFNRKVEMHGLLLRLQQKIKELQGLD